MRRSASDRGGDGDSFEFQPIVDGRRFGLIGESLSVKRGEEKVARAVPGKHPSGPVGSMGGGSEPDDHDPRSRVPEPRNRSGPVVPSCVGLALDLPNLFSVFYESRTAPTLDQERIRLVHLARFAHPSRFFLGRQKDF